jgi:hypothetical protein
MTTTLALLTITLAAYRVTRLVVADTISERPRRRILLAVPALASFLGCMWCAGLWVAAATVAAGWACGLIPGGRWYAPETLAASTVIGLLATVDR